MSGDSNNGREWTRLDCQVAARMLAEANCERFGDQARAIFLIAKELRRTEQGVRGRLRKYGPSFGDDFTRRSHSKHIKRSDLKQFHVLPLIVPPRVWAERERRLELEHASITAMLMGDPLPGCSALDKGQV